VVEDLPRKSEALSSIPIAAKRKKKKQVLFLVEGGIIQMSQISVVSRLRTLAMKE
jgi:hypothetical protein